MLFLERPFTTDAQTKSFPQIRVLQNRIFVPSEYPLMAAKNGDSLSVLLHLFEHESGQATTSIRCNFI